MYPIVNLNQQDYQALIAVWESSVRATHDFLPESRILELKPLILEQYFDAVQLKGVRVDSQILGFLGVHNKDVEMLFIRPDVRGKGVGKALLRHAIDILGCSKVDVNEQNRQAVDFYLHQGFKLVSRSPLDGQGEPYPILHMSLDDK